MARNPACTVYIGNLDEKVTERVLYEILIQPGCVVDLYIPRDKETSRPKGYAFAEYETEEIAQYAVQLFSGLVQLYGKTLKFAISGQGKTSSDGNNPVMPKLNPIPLPMQPQFMHYSDMPVLHTTAYPMINGGRLDFGLSHNYCSYSVRHTTALSAGPVHSNGGFGNGTYDCSRYIFDSGDYVLHVSGHGAPRQRIMYPSYS
ncbi:hypothetical protein GUJ93_ZPchr0044g38098 [Zizania palustris]|uniref:RRM domain-containing protein n=1 Tax=Zizania palustris TaxID=103762 RepID=A0A8J5VEF2_ZIZPA|nr:hypothetical protein GUJ93_ZPchr0044g38098 [Zizania palustris]